MYYQNYEDYMRQVLGYPLENPNIYETYDYKNNQITENTYFSNQYTANLTENEIQALYPNSYNVIYPVVCRVCEANTAPISRETVERLTDEVYNLVESNRSVVNINVETKKNENWQTTTNSRREAISKSEIKTDKRTPIKNENRDGLNQVRETRQNNQLLRDLIRILILQRLFGDGNRPPYPRPPRPPFPGGPGRPPIRPRTDINYN